MRPICTPGWLDTTHNIGIGLPGPPVAIRSSPRRKESVTRNIELENGAPAEQPEFASSYRRICRTVAVSRKTNRWALRLWQPPRRAAFCTKVPRLRAHATSFRAAPRKGAQPTRRTPRTTPGEFSLRPTLSLPLTPVIATSGEPLETMSREKITPTGRKCLISPR